MTSDLAPAQAAAAGFRAPAESDAVARIAAVTGELAAADSLDAVVTVVAEHICTAVRASVSTLILRDGDRLVIAGSHGVDAAKASRWASFRVDDENPASEAVRTGVPVVAATADEVQRRYPRMAGDTPIDRSVVNLPLRAAGSVIGAIGLTFEQNWNPGPAELDFLMTFADACAQTLRRVRATEAAQRSSVQLEFLASASLELSSSLDYRATLAKVAQLCVPTLADWCAVDVLVEDRLGTVALAHVDPAKVAWAWQLRERYPTDMDATAGAPQVVRTGDSELTDITDDLLVATALDEEHLRLCRELRMRSVLIVPLPARNRTLGTMTLIRSDSSPAFAQSDRTVAEELGRRAGLAIDNAQLHEQTVSVATRLQRALLPEQLGVMPGWHTDAHYQPVGPTEVGGDFFDAIALPDGRLAAFVGDVMGHGIKAAAAMAQVRAATRALLTVDPSPAVVIARLDEMFHLLSVGPLVTLVYAVLEPDGVVHLANAGHCPPVVVTPTGAEFLPLATRPPLGAGTAETRTTTALIEPGAALLLYTDGVIERRDEPIDAGLARLIHHAPSILRGETLAALVDEVAAGHRQDDVAALCVRRLAQEVVRYVP